MDNPPGARGSEGCRILSFLPERMLSFAWNAPPDFPDMRRSSVQTWVAVFFNSLSERTTEVKIHHVGWPDEKSWDPVFNYFDAAWGRVLESLHASC